MKKIIAALAVIVLSGCASFDTNVWRTEQTAVNLAYTAYQGWKEALVTQPITPQASNDVKQARLRFAATVGTVDALRAAYATNSAVKPQIEAILITVNSEASNLVWIVNFYRGTK